MKNQLKTISIKRRWLAVCLVALLGLSGATRAAADSDNSSSCTKLPSHAQLKSALKTVVALGSNGGLGNDMWVYLPRFSPAEVSSVYSTVIRSMPKPHIKEMQQISANPTIHWSVKKSAASMYSAAASRFTIRPEILSAVSA